MPYKHTPSIICCFSHIANFKVFIHDRKKLHRTWIKISMTNCTNKIWSFPYLLIEKFNSVLIFFQFLFLSYTRLILCRELMISWELMNNDDSFSLALHLWHIFVFENSSASLVPPWTWSLSYLQINITDL